MHDAPSPGPRPLRSADDGHSLCRDYSGSAPHAQTTDELNERIPLTNICRTLNQFIRCCERCAEVSTEGTTSCPDRPLTPLEGFTWKKQAVIIADQATTQ
jgi:hypothetical protein